MYAKIKPHAFLSAHAGYVFLRDPMFWRGEDQDMEPLFEVI